MVNVIPSIVFVTFSVLPLLINYFLKKKYGKLMKELKEDDNTYYHQCMFMNMKNFNCKSHLIHRVQCSEYCSYGKLKTLYNFISSAKSSICLCMYTVTLKQINTELIRAHKRGVNVRIITDKVMLQTDTSRCNFKLLSDNGIIYKSQPSAQTMMHHKFCLIDKEDHNDAKMFFGSMNLTGQGLTSNFDNVIITNNWNMIQRFSEEFEELWEHF